MEEEFTVVVGFETVNVKHSDFLGGHLEFYGKATSETGYRSFFYNQKERAGKPIQEFAQAIALQLNEELRLKISKKRRIRRLTEG